MKNSRRFTAGTIQLGLVVSEGRVTEVRLSGDFFSAGGVEEVKRVLAGRAYPFSELDAVLPDELLKRAFIGIDPGQVRAFFQE